MLRYPEFWNKKSALSFVLAPFSLIFIFGSFIRKIFSKPKHLGFPVICVGNATAGGTGKTPMIKSLAKRYLLDKKCVAIISKGYGGNYKIPQLVSGSTPASLVGDEAVELFDSLLSAGEIYVIVSKNPAETTVLLENIKPDIILVDDGMQNPNFHKDYKILMVDGERAFGNGCIIPAGPLRKDAESSIDEADIIVSINPSPIIENRLRLDCGSKFHRLNVKFAIEISSLEKILLLCAIGNPERFFGMLRQSYNNVVKEISFPDHHYYSDEDILYISKEAEKLGATKIVTTEKDYSKLKDAKFQCNKFLSQIPLEVCRMNFKSSEIDEIICKINLL